MNILFINDDDIDPERGGVKRSTHILARTLMDRYHLKCYLAYIRGFPECRTLAFDDKIQILDKDGSIRLEDFIVRHEIDIIILQKMLPKKYGVLSALEKVAAARRSKLIYVLHFSPDHEILDLAPVNIVNNIRYARSWIYKAVNLGKLAAYPAYRSIKRCCLRLDYKRNYRRFDRIVLLSQSYIPNYARLAGLAEYRKLVAIGNPISSDTPVSREEISRKEREVLIVSRFDEKQKKLYRALEIWRQIECHEESRDWRLVIVGFGPWGDRYKKRAAALGLKSVVFVGGPKDPRPYYRRASVFMMTSAYEGFAMVLLESQQMGVVPLAFDSFGSLHDVIQDGYNGLIVPNADLKAYAERLIWLMRNKDRREEMAGNAVESCTRFSGDHIGAQWIDLFKSVISEPFHT